MDVVLKMNGLDGLIADPGVLGGEVVPDGHGDEAADNREGNTGLDDGLVRTFGENIGHGGSWRF